MKKLRLINLIFLISTFLLAISSSFSQWEPPCVTDCTGEWQEDSIVVYTPGCVTCEITIHYHYRIANCPNNNPPEEYQFHIDSFDGSPTCYMCWTVPNNVEFFKMVLNRFLIKIGTTLQDGIIIKISFASCWSANLFGPFPTMQPCNNTYCCKTYYGVSGGIVWYIGDDNDPLIQCPTEPNDCVYICDPNGYLYKRSIDENLSSDNQKINVAPNPNNGHFSISFIENINDYLLIEIVDLKGHTVFQKTFTKEEVGKETLIDLKNLQSGTYQIILNDGYKLLGVEKIIILK